ncbi:MAG: hypothetical protein Q7R71_01770 [bacterium]|nr:hypothetical protein [bacterium]
MQKTLMIVKLFKTHMFALLLALLVGAIYAGPDIYHAMTPGYQGILMADSPDAAFYLTNINKSYTSPGLLGDPFLYEYQNVRNPFQYFVIDFALGKIGAVLHLPIDIFTMIMGFFFPALLTLLLYAFVYKLSGSRLAGFCAAGAVLLGNEIARLSSMSNIAHTFLLDGSYREFLNYSRPVNPQVSSIFFFGALFCLLYLLRNPRSRVAIILSGISLGLLVYIYVYFWAFAFVMLGVMGIYALTIRNWSLALGTIGAGAVSLLCIAPFLLANVPILLHGGASGLTQAISTHQIIIEKVILLPLFLYTLIFLWAWWSRGQGRVGEWASLFATKYVFVLLLLIAGVIVSNQQVITGKLIFLQHFHFFTNIPMFLLSMSVLGFEILTFVNLRWRIVAIGAVVTTLAWFSLGVQVSSYKAHSEESARYQMLAPIFAYLNTQARPNSVVFTDSYLSSRLTIYTQDFVYYASGYDVTYQVPQERLIHDYFVVLALRGVTADSIRPYLYQNNNREEVGGTLYVGTYWRDLCGSYICFPDSVLENLIPQYESFLTRPLTESIRAHKIDYLLWDKVTDAGWKIDKIVEEDPLIESGDFALYLIR